MLKYDLRQQDYSMRDKAPNQLIITMVWVFLTIFLIIGTFTFVFMNVGSRLGNESDPLAYFYEALGPFSLLIIMVGPLVLYMILKFFMTLLFCHSIAHSSIHLKILEGTAMPVCFCREAFKVWQTVLMYFVPVVLIYSAIFWLCVTSGANAMYMILLFFMTFYIAYDLTLVLYVLLYKLIYRIDYISIDHHVYFMTLYNKSYVRETKKAKKMLETQKR